MQKNILKEIYVRREKQYLPNKIQECVLFCKRIVN